MADWDDSPDVRRQRLLLYSQHVDASARCASPTTTGLPPDEYIDYDAARVAHHDDDHDHDHHEWPSVYDEARSMLLAAVLMYGVVDLRTLARKPQQQQQQQSRQQQQNNNNDKDDKDSYDASTAKDNVDNNDNDDDQYWLNKLLTPPIAAKDVVRLLARHHDKIVQEIGRASTDLYLDAFDGVQSSTPSSRALELEFCNGRVSLVSFTIVHVADQHQDQELVYAICVDTDRRRILVLFRGCSTSTDWTVCATNFLKVQNNPLYETTTTTKATTTITTSMPQAATIAIHQGYCSYLFDKKKYTGTTSSHWSKNNSKFQDIVQRVQALLQQHPGYKVYVTGHSLGAALATVFSFQAAATHQFDNINNNNNNNNSLAVTCINFASPMVGNLHFERAFSELEAQGRIRCLRVTNHFDIFTQLPDRGNWLYVFACCWGFHLITYVGWTLMFFLFFQSNVYRHVGMDLHMYRHRRISSFCCMTDDCSFKIKHSRGTPRGLFWRLAHDWKKHFKQTIQRLLALPFAMNFNTNHSVQEHLWRLTQLSSEMQHLRLADLYDTHRSRQEDTSAMPDCTEIPFSPCEPCTSAFV